MAGGLIGGAALGAFFGELLKPFTSLISKARKFKTTHKNLASTVKRVVPVVEEMKPLAEKLDCPKEETERLMEELQQGQSLVSKYSKIPWWKCCCLPCYQDKLQEMDEKLGRSLALVMQAGIARDVKKTLLAVEGIGGKQFKGLCKAPEKPDLTVGLDGPYNKLKIQLLQSGASIFVLTGLAGSGKTTLATLLCWDEDLRGKFGEKILFVTVSKAPNLKIIVQTLFQHCGWDVPDLRNDEQMVMQLKILLMQIGEGPMMLVLDDVWLGSEWLIEAFNIQLPDYKVLVTSRFEFPRFVTSCHLKPLCDEDAVTLFRHFALLKEGSSYIPEDDVVQKVAKSCWGSPIALKLVGRSLCGHPFELWEKMEKELSKGRSVLEKNADLLTRLQKYLDDVLEDKPIIRECFMDLGLFPEDQKIPVAALIDMWTELHKLDDDSTDAMINVNELTNRHLANHVVTSEVASHVDNYYNHHFLMQHDLPREIAIHQASQEPYEQRKRLIFYINEINSPAQNQQQAVARTLSISTDKMFTPDWCNVLPAEVVEVLVLNLRTNDFTLLPEFMEKMSTLKVLIVTNYDGFHFSEIHNFELLGSLSSLKRIRLEQVSVPSLGKLSNLRKLSLYKCNTSEAFGSGSIKISDALPNLVELSMDYCKDLVKLPAELCDIITLKKLSITKCISFSALPLEIGNLVNLEILRLSSCYVLKEIPASIGRLRLLLFLDISQCISLGSLPEEIGDLLNLKKLHMTGCSRCELPSSVNKLENLRRLICDEETQAFWEPYRSSLPNLKIEESKDVGLLWLGGGLSLDLL